jgi:NAD(P)H-hydrate epimerase
MRMVPSVTGEQMAAVDRAMVEVLGLDIRQIMETAGRQVAVFARRMLGGDPRGQRVVAVCGTGGNGGDGMVAARYLRGWGAAVQVALAHEPDPDRHLIASRQLTILRAMGITTVDSGKLPVADLIIDGLLGFSTRAAPSGRVADLISAINRQHAPVLAIDLPSGLQATTGEPFDPTVTSTATLTLGLPKTGLLASTAERHVGDLWLADIGIPLEAYAATGLTINPLFAREEFIHLTT